MRPRTLRRLVRPPVQGRALVVCLLALSLLSAACSPRPPGDRGGDAPVSDAVREAHRQVARSLRLDDPQPPSDAARGFIAAPTGQVRDRQGQVIWDYDAFAFVTGAAPPSVNPSLWRQALLNNRIGLFEVVPGIWQLRGFDLANITLIEGRTGWIVVDAATSRETAAAAMAFARRHLGDRPVSALVFTHSHVDHFGGALGVISAEEVRRRAVPVVAPAGFLAEATSENLMMGVAMGRRSLDTYGSRLTRGPTGLVDNGLGKSVALGEIGLLAPTIEVSAPEQTIELDGRRFVFHNMPGGEAPAEFVFYLPEFQAFGGAEMMGHTLHNLYTLRGAKVRDGLKWSAHLDDALRHASQAQVLFLQHHWPVWGNERIRDFIARQRDVYKYLHDQTVRRLNAGHSAAEIAETLTLPESLATHLDARGYYGTVRHNVRAVVQHYLGWYDGNPATLDPVPPREAAGRYVALAGGAKALLEAAQRAFDRGEFRWAAELLRHLILADPNDRAATRLQARTFEQLGYAAESATWRNVYLSGALELRDGPPAQGIPLSQATEMLRHAPRERLLERVAASVDGPAAAALEMTLVLRFIDLDETYELQLRHGVLHHRRVARAGPAQATLELTHEFFIRAMTGQLGVRELLDSPAVRVQGSAVTLARFLNLLERSPGNFPLATR